MAAQRKTTEPGTGEDVHDVGTPREPDTSPEPGAPPEPAAESPAPVEAEREADLAAEIGRLEDRWRRALADLDNTRKRYARERDQERARERQRVAAAWLPVVDNLDLAARQSSDADSGVSEALAEGIRAIRDQAVAVMADLGFVRDAETGVPFDPARHEVVEVTTDTEAEEGTVVRVLRPGYGHPGGQLRPASVVVAGRRE